MSLPQKAKAPAVHGGEAESVEPEAAIVSDPGDMGKTFWDRVLEGKVRPGPIYPPSCCDRPCCQGVA